MKKIIAMTAAAMILLASGCGSIEEEKAAAPNTIDDVSTVSESSVSESESDTDESSSTETLTSGEETSVSECSEDGSGEEVKEYEPITNIEGYKGEYINDGNSAIIVPNTRDYPEVDREILYYSAELAIKQYNLIARRDKKGFYDMLGYDRIFRSEDFVKSWAEDISGREHIDTAPESLNYDGASWYMWDLLGNEWDDTFHDYEFLPENVPPPYDDDYIYTNCERLIRKAADMASWDNADYIYDEYFLSCFNRLKYKYRSIDENEFFAQPEKFVLTPSEDTVYIIKYGNGISQREEEGVYTNIDVIVINGDYAFHFDNCGAFLTSGESFVTPFYVAVTENRWKGLTAKEAGEKIFDEYYSDEAKIAEELSYEAWLEIIPDAGYDSGYPAPEPPSWDELMAAGTFPLTASEKGLDLSTKEKPEAGGDYSLTTCYGIENGTVYMIRDPDDKNLFYIRYVSPEGKIGEYHTEDNHWF